MVYSQPFSRSRGYIFPVLILLFLTAGSLSAQEGSYRRAMESAGSYLIPSWSSTRHRQLDTLISTIASLPRTGGAQNFAAALSAWRDKYYALSGLMYEKLIAADGSDQSDANTADFIRLRSGLISDGRGVTQLLASAQWDGEDFAEIASDLAGAMPLIRPDLSPNGGFWLSLLSDVDGPGTYFKAASVEDAQALIDFLKQKGLSDVYHRALLRPLAPPGTGASTGPSDFDWYEEDPVSLIYSAAAGGNIISSRRYLLEDEAHTGSLTAVSSFQGTFDDLKGGIWSEYIADLGNIESGLDKTLPSNLKAEALRQRMYLANGQLSDDYWNLLSLLENPFFIAGAERAVQIEQVQLSLVDLLKRSQPSGMDIYPLLYDFRSGEPAMSTLPMGKARAFIIAVSTLAEAESDPALKYSGEAGLISLWSTLSRDKADVASEDLWHLQSGFIPLVISSGDNSWQALHGERRSLYIMTLASDYLNRDWQGPKNRDPTVADLLDFRRMVLISSIYRELSGAAGPMPRPGSLELKYRIFFNLNDMLLAEARAPRDVKLSSAWKSLIAMMGDERFISSLDEDIRTRLR